MIFDWVDVQSRGRLSLEEFSLGLKNIFGSSPGTHRLRTKRSLPSQRVSVTSSFPVLEEANAEEKEAFLALVGQMETGHSFSERDSDHLHKVRQLYEETEEQICREKQQLQAQSDSRDMALSAHMQEALEAKEQEVQRLAEGQRELEAQILHLSSTQQEASWENLQLREAERDLAGQLEEVRGQLQVTRGHLDTARTRGRVSWQIEEEPSVPRANKEAPDPQAVPTEEAPLPELFGENDDWNQLLSSFEDRSHSTLRLCWSPPSTPSSTSAPQTPRVVRQISISKSLEEQLRPEEGNLGERGQQDPGSSETNEVESKSGAPQSTEPVAESRPEDPRTDLREAEQSSSPGDRTAAKPQADPDYLYHVIFLGDSNVGKTSFLHLLHHDAFATGLTATVGVDFRVKNLLVDNKTFALQLWDTAGQERYHSLTRQLLRKAEGVVLMYDITSQESFTHVRYWLDCLQDAGVEGVAMVLLGNKMDCEEERQVPTEAGRRLAQELGVSFSECSAALGHNILEPMMNLARSLKMQEDRLKASLVEVTHPQPPKKASCCR
ncbi:ras-related protein Rab-44 isoform X2 [Grammomys surdaster]|uniref:ras-related protein Rab-44 isoform X2 n=1 Tax=Grammomys surdaster TaxID=491861 RepID=UPI0010A0A9DF|nr:ras-related protein Rab-44 isoform X2 [Grammomys surdaster]